MRSLWSELSFGLSDKIKLVWWEMQWEHVGSKWENMWGASTVCGLVAKLVGNLITLKQLKMYFSLWSLKVNTLEKGVGLTSTSVWYSWKNSAFWVCLWGSLASEVASARYSLWCDLRWNLFTCLPSECCWADAVCARCLPSGTHSDCELEIREKLLYLLSWSLKGWRLQAWQSSCLVWGTQPRKAK